MTSRFSLNLQSVQAILGKVKQVVVYGYHDCQYSLVCTNLRDQGYETYNYIDGVGSLRKELHNGDIYGNSEHAFFSQAQTLFKGVLTNLVLINYKRSQRGLPIIPLLFCVESDYYSEWKIDILRMMNEEDSFTAKELRRCYKIYSELNDAFQRVAEETFKFVRVQQVTGEKQQVLIPLQPFWQHPDWESKWKERMQEKSQKPERPKSDWRYTLMWKSYVFDEEPERSVMSCMVL